MDFLSSFMSRLVGKRYYYYYYYYSFEKACLLLQLLLLMTTMQSVARVSRSWEIVSPAGILIYSFREVSRRTFDRPHCTCACTVNKICI